MVGRYRQNDGEAQLESMLQRADEAFFRLLRRVRRNRGRGAPAAPHGARASPAQPRSSSRTHSAPSASSRARHAAAVRTFRAARKRFNALRDQYARRLGVGAGGQVHHAIELQALRRYPGVFTPGELNSFTNMRGIPAEVGGRRQLHNAKVREMWDRHYRQLDQTIRRRGLTPGTPAYNNLVRRWLTSARDEIDYVLGQFFSEYRTGRPRSFQ